MTTLNESELIYDWNVAGTGDMKPARSVVQINDETLRDGLQSPSVETPSIEDKIRILHLLAELGIDAVDLGLPGAGPHVVEHVTALAEEIVRHKLPLAANCAARTMAADILPIIEVSQKTGLEIEVACFIGSSPIRQYSEGWEMDRMLKLSEDAVELAVGEGMPVMFVTEDTTRAAPDDIRRLYSTAVESGARRVCVADTVGHSTPQWSPRGHPFCARACRCHGGECRSRLAWPPRSRDGSDQRPGRSRGGSGSSTCNSPRSW